ncbi:hypothetical protein DFJ73DRAFT_623591 [Zopfochytrium polystomum]|nr:hypothetical protein DFJ73DRAFT_623591 [Zopfochytrium polystomum]
MTKRAVDAACTDPSPQPASSSVTTSNHSSAGHIASPPNDLEDPTRSVSDSEKIVELLESADSWNWDLFTMDTATSGRPLITLSHFLFLRSNLYAILHIPVEKFLKFVEAIESGYHREVPYHNALHATDVLHGVSYLLASCEEVVPMGDLELMALYTAAVIHDYNHPGKNNNFLVNTLDEMALLYNDRSVLENHHLSTAFRVLIQTEHNFLQHLCRDDFKQVRELIIELVLATDLQTQHFAILSMFKNKVCSISFDPYNNDEDRNLLWKMIIKCADVSNPTKAMPLYTQWTERVLQEFFLQGNETAAGLPISPYYDRDTISVPNSQIGFIEFICVSTWCAVMKCSLSPAVASTFRSFRCVL